MDCLFKKLIPKGDPKTIIIKPAGKMFANGLAYSYSEDYPP